MTLYFFRFRAPSRHAFRTPSEREEKDAKEEEEAPQNFRECERKKEIREKGEKKLSLTRMGIAVSVTNAVKFEKKGFLKENEQHFIFCISFGNRYRLYRFGGA